MALKLQGLDFLTRLADKPQVREALSAEELHRLLDPASHTGLSAALARETALRARQVLSAGGETLC